MSRTELLETYLKSTDLTVKELIDRNAFAQIMQFAEAYRLEQLRLYGVGGTCCDETRKVNQFLKRPSKYCMTCSKELK